VLLWLIARVFSSRGDGTDGVIVDADGLWTLRRTSSAELLLKRSYCSSAKVFNLQVALAHCIPSSQAAPDCDRLKYGAMVLGNLASSVSMQKILSTT
jgi:hypothetical protein